MLRVGLVHPAAELGAPLGDRDGEDDVAGDADEGDERIPAPEQRPQDAADEQDFQQRRQNVEQHEAEEEVDALGAALDRPADGAGAPVEVEPQAQRVQVLEGSEAGGTDRPLRHLGEHRVSEFAERLREHARDAVGDDQHHRDGGDLAELVGRESVDDELVQRRDGDVHPLGGDQEEDGRRHPSTEFRLSGRPQIRQQRDDGTHVAAAGGRTGR